MFLFGPPNVIKMKARQDVKGLIKALEYQKDSDIRALAARFLGELGDSRAVEPLIAALEDTATIVCQAAADALGKIKDPRAVEPLIATLKNTFVFERRSAAIALGKIGDARAVEPLIAALKDTENIVRQAAADALGKIKDPRAVEPLIAALEDDNSDVDVQRIAAMALGEIGDARAVEPLIAALEDRANVVRQAAAIALERLGWQPSGKLKTVSDRLLGECPHCGKYSESIRTGRLLHSLPSARAGEVELLAAQCEHCGKRFEFRF